jgi:hypothetical protein
MSDQPPPSAFTLTPARITILVLGALAIVMIVGAILGGVGNYQELKEAASSAQASAPSSGSASSP